MQSVYKKLYYLNYKSGKLQEIENIPQEYIKGDEFLEVMHYDYCERPKEDVNHRNEKVNESLKERYLTVFYNKLIEPDYPDKDLDTGILASRIATFFLFNMDKPKDAEIYYYLSNSYKGKSENIKIAKEKNELERAEWLARWKDKNETHLNKIRSIHKDLTKSYSKGGSVYAGILGFYHMERSQLPEREKFAEVARYKQMAVTIESCFDNHLSYGLILYKQGKYLTAKKQLKLALRSSSSKRSIWFLDPDSKGAETVDKELNEYMRQNGQMHLDHEMQRLLAYYYLAKCCHKLKLDSEARKFLKKIKKESSLMEVDEENGKLASAMQRYIEVFLRG